MIFGAEALAAWGTECRTVANLAVPGAGFEDLVIAAGLVADQPGLRVLYVGVDPWTFRFDSDRRWAQYATTYHDARRRLGLPSATRSLGGLDAVANLVNGQYFLSNLEALYDRGDESGADGPKEVAVDGSNLTDDERYFRPDGSQVASRGYLAAPPLPEGQIANGSVKIQPPYLDSRVTAEFETILARFHVRGVQVVLLLAPYHPKVLRCSSEKTCFALQIVETWVRDFARYNGYTVIGGYDPRPLGLGPEMFHDALHMDALGIPALTPH